MGKVAAKDVPLTEITLRKYDPPYRMTQREMVKKVCLSLGLLQAGDSRDVIVDILHLLIKNKEGLYYGKLEEMLIKKRKRHKLPMVGVTPANVHRQLRRLKDMQLIDKHLNRYRMAEKMKLNQIFEERIVAYHLNSIVGRVKEYCDKLSK